MTEEKRDWSLMGSSYIPALVDDNYFLKPIDIWLKMTKKNLNNIYINNRILWGNRLEEAIIKSFEEDHKVKLTRNVNFISPSHPLFCATPDGVDLQKRLIVEVKNIASDQKWQWGEDGTEDSIPLHILTQVHWQLMVVNDFLVNKSQSSIENAYVRALFGGNECFDYTVKYDIETADRLINVADDFIDTYVKTDTAPPIDASNSYREYLKWKFPIAEKNKIVESVTDNNVKSLIENYLDLQSKKETIENDLNFTLNKLIDFIGDRYGIQVDGLGKFLYYNVTGRVSHKDVISALQKLFNIEDRIIQELSDKNRGKDYCVPRFYPEKQVR